LAGERTLRLVVSYDGTGYAGFQRQKDAPSVQAALETALATVTGEPRVRVVAAGRTDAGVHALGQVVSFRTAGSIPTDRVGAALNGVLPPDIRVLDAAEVDQGFHARYRARRKVYQYNLLHGPVVPPFLRPYCLHAPARLDLDAMVRAGASLVGRHDFSAFRDAGGRPTSPVRTIYRLEWERVPVAGALPFGPGAGGRGDPVAPGPLAGDVLRLTVEGDGFLHHMVRVIVGTLLEVGRGRLEPQAVAVILSGRDRSRAGPTAPGHGLCLVSVAY